MVVSAYLASSHCNPKTFSPDFFTFHVDAFGSPGRVQIPHQSF